ncbi:MAG: TetR/AcrR family transcriptional regulator [Luteibacter sp.]
MTHRPLVSGPMAKPTPPPSPGPATSEKALTVLAAARRIFLDHGFGAATTDMIQQAAAVSKSTVYAHYPNKEALFRAVVESECERLVAEVRAVALPAGSLKGTLTTIGAFYLAMVLSPDVLAMYRLIVAEAPRFPELAARFYVTGPGAMNDIVSGVLDTALADGALDFGGVGRDAAAALFVGMVRSEAQMQSLTHPGSPPSAVQQQQWVRDAVTTFLRAFTGAR